MLKTNQKNVHAFEIEKQEPEAVMEFLEKTMPFCNIFLLFLNTILNQKSKPFCINTSFCF
ncbi:septum formation inhibitor [Helicobacter pylori Hp P-8]|nr:septum formation inhibitor [Helicobacter pylori Hp P-8]